MALTILWWFLCSTLIGWLCFPLTSKIFPNLPSKGYAFTRSIGLLIWGYFYWLLVSLGVLGNTLLSQVLVLSLVVGISIYLGFRSGFKQIWKWVRSEWRLILGVELVFLAAFLGFVFFRGSSPAIFGTEKPMELAFLNAVFRADTFPPHDPWLSGYPISYYYFGYVLVSIIARLTGTTAAVAFNLSQALWFGLIALSAYGILIDLLAVWFHKTQHDQRNIKGWMLRWATLAPILILMLGNAYGFFEALHSRGLFWDQTDGEVFKSQFWDWMDLRGLREPPTKPLQWQPHASGTVPWWNASRVLQDSTLTGEAVEIIDEFPNFSFVLGDLHPHLLAMPFALLAIGLVFEEFVNTGSSWQYRRIKLPIHPGRFIVVSGLIGSLAFLNTWDWPIYAALYAAVLTIRRVALKGWQFRRLLEFIIFGLCSGTVGFILFLPFFLSFSSQAAGILPSLVFFTRGSQFWVMFGIFLVPICGYLFWRYTKNNLRSRIKAAIFISVGFVVLMVILNVAMSLVAVRLGKLGDLFLANLGASGMPIGELLWAALKLRLLHPGTSLLLTGMMALSLYALFSSAKNNGAKIPEIHRFIVLLILWGVLLTLIPEYIYLLDSFGTRMNTIFKFYFQVWILWSLAGTFAVVILFRHHLKKLGSLSSIFSWVAILLTGSVLVLTTISPLSANMKDPAPLLSRLFVDWMWVIWAGYLVFVLLYLMIRRCWLGLVRIIIIYLLGVGLFYPLRAIPTRINSYAGFPKWTLDGSAYYEQQNPDLMLAINRLSVEKIDVLVEAVGPDGGDYSYYARVSMLSGMPTVLGWQYHELQWRGGDEAIRTRPADVALLYETTHWETAKAVIDKYNIEYIYIGKLERETYDLQEEKLRQNMNLFFEHGNVTIYSMNVD
jgi:YYY domain-containing protein